MLVELKMFKYSTEGLQQKFLLVPLLLKRARGHLKGATILSPDLAEVIAMLNCYSLIKKVIKHTKLACLCSNCHHVWYVHLPGCHTFCPSVLRFFDLKS